MSLGRVDQIIELALNISRAVQHAEDFDAIVRGLVEDDVALRGEAAQIHQKIVARARPASG